MTVEILVVGALHLDVVVDAPGLPRLDETLVGTDVDYRFGGKGGNQAVAAARMGARVAMAGAVGEDAFADRILTALDDAGVDRQAVVQRPGSSGMSVAITDPEGDYGAVIVSGVNRDMRAEDVSLDGGVAILLLQNEIPETVNVDLATRVGDQTKLILNAAPARPPHPELFRQINLLVVNRIEASDLTGKRNPEAAAQALMALGPKTAIVTLGGDGLVAATRSGRLLRLAGHRVPVVSTHGAGDAFVGALAARLAGRDDLEDALSFAQAAAALHVSAPVAEQRRISPKDVTRFCQTSSR